MYNTIHQQHLNQHTRMVNYAQRYLSKKFKDAKIVVVSPIPDIIIVDFENKRLIAVEVSKFDEKIRKLDHYSKSDFKELILVRKNIKGRKVKMSFFQPSS
jgi:hypothetical protein